MTQAAPHSGRRARRLVTDSDQLGASSAAAEPGRTAAAGDDVRPWTPRGSRPAAGPPAGPPVPPHPPAASAGPPTDSIQAWTPHTDRRPGAAAPAPHPDTGHGHGGSRPDPAPRATPGGRPAPPARPTGFEALLHGGTDDPLDGEDGGRGRHATPSGQGFGGVVGWTILGSLLPGAGLVVAGRKISGAALLTLTGAVLGAAAGFVAFGDPVQFLGATVLGSPRALLAVAVGLVVGALLWAGVVIATHVSLRRFNPLTTPQRALSTTLVIALIGVGVIPAVKGSSYALITRDTLQSVFSSTTKLSDGAQRPNSQTTDPWANVSRVNVLLIGADSAKDRYLVRPDTLIVASIDTHSGETSLFSLPRNLQRVPFPPGSPAAADYPNGFHCINPRYRVNTECLLNALWTFGTNHANDYYKGVTNPGLTATVQGVEQVTGLKIDNYVLLNFSGFQRFINAIGGVVVNVSERLPIAGSVENPRGVTGYIEPGPNQRLDGYHLMWFARSRLSTDDFSRMRRQRCVIGAIVQQADPVKLSLAFPAIAAAAKDNIQTDIPMSDVGAWVSLSLRVKKAHVRSLPFTPAVIGSSENPDFDQIRELVQSTIQGPAAAPTPSAAPSPKPSATRKSGATPNPSPTEDARTAQDVTAVC